MPLSTKDYALNLSNKLNFSISILKSNLSKKLILVNVFTCAVVKG
jgi:hypothetical protein